MPLYEEKLINPLAVRFTQEHIRTTFRDSRPVEPTVEEIEVKPGTGDYDFILKAPFPHIEIIRWRPPSFTNALEEDGSVETPDAQHWFTLDNRRLYCLQKAAAALLPKRCAAVVELLYGDDGHVWRKYDTETQGRSVSISHSTRVAPHCHWTWSQNLDSETLVAAKAAVQVDDQKVSVDALQDAEAPTTDAVSDLLARFEAHEALIASDAARIGNAVANAAKSGPAVTHTCTTPSTTDDSSDDGLPSASGRKRAAKTDKTSKRSTSTDSDGSPSSAASTDDTHSSILRTLRSCLEGAIWAGRRGETYEIVADGEGHWVCYRKDKYGSKRFTLSYDQEYSVVYWGIDMAFFCDATEVEEGAEQLDWYGYADWDKKKPRFEWKASRPAQAKEASGVKKEAVGSSSLEAKAIEELCAQLAASDTDGRVRMPHWSSHYATLGPMRAFLEKHTEHFVVTPGRGTRFAVALAN